MSVSRVEMGKVFPAYSSGCCFYLEGILDWIFIKLKCHRLCRGAPKPQAGMCSSFPGVTQQEVYNSVHSVSVLGSFMSTWHKLEASERKEPQLRTYLHTRQVLTAFPNLVSGVGESSPLWAGPERTSDPELHGLCISPASTRLLPCLSFCLDLQKMMNSGMEV